MTKGSQRSAKRVMEIAFERELGQAFGRYAQKVILDRAIPDVRDGLKPVQRRIIYAMFNSGNTPDKAYRKSAKTVGDVMGTYHPHGDSAIYEAMVRLAQPWKMRYPLVDGHGNFGSMDDDPAAAMRYTEARLSPIALELLTDIGKETVPWRANFDESCEEPVVLPAGFLGLLCNGTSGVSAGFATEVPSHNLGEVVDAAVALVRDASLDVDALMQHVKGPDFPTGGVMMGAEGLKEAYTTGRGKVVLRARHETEKLRDGKRLLVFKEMPYNVVKSELVRQMDNLRLSKGVQGVLDVRDESDREGIRIVAELSRNADPDGVLKLLFKKTDLQINYHFNMVSIMRNSPRQLDLRSMIAAFVEHRRVVVKRRSQYDLERALTRLHLVEGLMKALDILDEVIATIRASKDRADARLNLMTLGFSEAQADGILDLRLVRLTNLEIKALRQETKELRALIRGLRSILGDATVCDQVVCEELLAIKERHGDARRTTIEDEVERLEVALEVVVKAQDVVVGVTEQGWIKRASLASFQGAGGDRKAAGVRPGDRMHDVVFTNTRHKVLVFSSSGACFPIPVHQIPEAKWGDSGTALVNVCGIDKEDDIVAVIPRADFADDVHLLFLTERGMAKACKLKDFESSRASGIVAIKLGERDKLSRVTESNLSGDCVLLTRLGQGIRFTLDQVSIQGRMARGVRAMKVADNDVVIDTLLLSEERLMEAPHIAVFTLSGMAKLNPIDDMARQNRGGKGVRMIVRRASRPHTCIALGAATPKDRFVLIDGSGTRHAVEASRIPVTRRDGNAWTMARLSGGATVTLVEFWPYVPPESDAEEADAEEGAAAEAAAGGLAADGVRVRNDAPTEPDLPPIIIED
jgi:topoisomerase IV subunit A